MMKFLLSSIALISLLFACGQKPLSKAHTSPSVVIVPAVEKNEWQFDGAQGVQFITPHWDIRSTIQIPRIVDTLPDFYNDLLDHYTTVFGELPYPRKRINVFLFATESQWRKKLQEMLGADATQWYSLGRGGLTVDGTGVLYHLDRRGRSRVTLRIAAHEGWHQYAEATFKICLPTWLDEGIGTWMEGFRIRNGEVVFTPASNWDRLSTVRKLVQAERLDSLEYLLSSDPSSLLASGRTTLLGYYAQLWALTSFIIEFEEGKYFPALKKILRSALDGSLRVPRGGWMYAFTDSPAAIEREYIEWVKEYVRPGSSWR
jgi:hypothetical protein